MRSRVAFMVMILVVVLAAGCHSSSHPPATQSAASTTPATTSPGPATSAPQAAATTSTAARTTLATSACPTSVLVADLSAKGAAAGTAYSQLVFHNKSGRTCTMAGYPGVSFTDSSGHQIGAAVPRQHRFAGAVTLASQGSAGALFAYHDAYVSTVEGCQPVMATGVLVYPPNQTETLQLANGFLVCSNPATPGTASISEVTALANLP